VLQPWRQPLNFEPFELDPFQLEAAASIDSGHHVLVSAPTGAGKTVVADHAVDRALRLGRRAVYTTPVKALSNQKFLDLTERLGAERVGLLTGDRRVNPGAPVVVMTTEVLRALLYEGAFGDHLGLVVLDEAHFITDPDRGPAWEEVVLHAPANTQIVALSATLDEADLLAHWIRSLRGPTDLVVCDQRPVPLRHLYAIGRLDNSPPVLLPVMVEDQPNPSAITMDGPRVRDTRGEGLRRRYRDRARAVSPRRTDLLGALVRAELAPVIWFVLSRRGCEAVAKSLIGESSGFTSFEESLELRRRAEALVASLPPEDLRAVDLGGWCARLAAGIGSHHGALLPAQRELVESAFREGLLRVVVATETLALGVNLPARSVVVDRVRRAGDEAELMNSAAFAQLAGRAGRRGLDPHGTAVVPWIEDTSFLQVAALVAAPSRPLRSWFRPTPVMVANLHRAGGEAADRAISGSLAAFLRTRRAEHLDEELARLRGEIAAVEAHRCEECVPPSASGPRSPALPHRSWGDAAAGLSLEALSVGDVVLDPGRLGFVPSVVTAAPRKRRGEAAVDLVQPDGRRWVLAERELRQPPIVLARLDVSAWQTEGRGAARSAADALRDLDLSQATERAKGAAAEARPEERNATACPADRLPRLRKAAETLADQVHDLRAGDWPDFQRTVQLLRDLGHLDGDHLTPKGDRLRRLFVPAGLGLAAWLEDGGHRGLDGSELAAAVSWFTPISSSRDHAVAEKLPTAALVDAWRRAGLAHDRVSRAAHEAGLDPPPSPERTLTSALFRWCVSGSLSQALADTGISPGDLGREARQVAELLDQVARAEPALTPLAETAQSQLLRGPFHDAG
jgi:ATP-dependent RNA helicase HelY